MKKRFMAFMVSAVLAVTPFAVQGEALDDGGAVNGESISGKEMEPGMVEEILQGGEEGSEDSPEAFTENDGAVFAEEIQAGAQLLSDDTVNAEEVGAVRKVYAMYRLYNPNSGEHFYTSNARERDDLVSLGWNDEGIGWRGYASGTMEIFRMYNPAEGYEEHHYTANQNEIKGLEARGWKKEGRAWASDEKERVPVYRLFNPMSQNSASSHHYTTNAAERKELMNRGWNDEGIGWYAVEEGEAPKPTPTPTPEPTPAPQPEIDPAVNVGDTIKFGYYEQSNNTADGTEPIEWKVLAKEDGRILVISSYGLDAKPYHESFTHVTWSTCTLRTWLNTTFMNTAFNEEQQSRIPTVNVPAHKTGYWRSNPGPDTQDRIFLLSFVEAGNIFSSDVERLCVATPYAKAQGAEVINGLSWWWLRSPGYGNDDAAGVYVDGSLQIGEGALVSNPAGCVRPVLWINLEA